MDAGPPDKRSFNQRQMDHAIAASLNPVKKGETTLGPDLGEAKRLHDADLYKTQENYYSRSSDNNANVLVLVMYPDSRSTTSCRYTSFNTGRICLTYKQVLATGSNFLAGLLVNERYQHVAKKTAAPLPKGVDYVLNLSPTTDENDYTIALQLLSTPHSVQLWHRSVALGASPLAVAGHDEVCGCLMPFDEPYPFPTPPESLKSKHGNVCIFDTKEWPLEEHRKIIDFCTTRWAANTLRLVRAIAMPPGQKDLLIDSAPRMWTLVGLFAKLEMTNYDILRDEVAAWFNADGNHAFVELCPEETLFVGHILKTPLLTEPAFRILVNERALEVAGGQPRLQPTTTVFGRRCSGFTGTDVAESISRMIEHASNAMAERHKIALDGLCGDNALDLLEIPQWQRLCALDGMISHSKEAGGLRHTRAAYDRMMSMIRQVFRNSVDGVVHAGAGDLPTDLIDSDRNDYFRRKGLTVEQIDEKRACSVPKRELTTTYSFGSVYASLNRYQRALTPIMWQALNAMADGPSVFVNKIVVVNTVADFRVKFDQARRDSKFPGLDVPDLSWPTSHDAFCNILFKEIMAGLKAYVGPLVNRDEQAFTYTLTPHLLLALNDHELNFLRLADDESTFQTEAPETDLGPSGPGPAFHTGQTIPSVSDLDFDKLTIESSDGATTVGGSLAVQDGVSTVYDRNRVLARPDASSVTSEQFTDGDMSAEYADAEYEVPADHQLRGQNLAHIVEENDDDYDHDDYDGVEYEVEEDTDSDVDENSECGTVMGDDDAKDVQPEGADHFVDDINVSTENTHSDASKKDVQDEMVFSEDSDDSDFEVITFDETT